MSGWTVHWRRVDLPGRETCHLARLGDGWLLSGAVGWRDGTETATLTYRVSCNRAWHCRHAEVAGWIGLRAVSLDARRDVVGSWVIDGHPRPEFAGLHDVDLGFTPATNTCAIRRMDLGQSGSGTTNAVWLNPDGWTLSALRQSYRRTGPNQFTYASPQHDFRADLTVDDAGLVVDYPGLFARDE